MVAPSWHFRASWQGHGSMPPLQRNPHRAFSLCHHPPPPCAACRHRILLRIGAVSRLHIEPKSTKPRCVPHIFIGHRHRRRRLTKRPLVARCEYKSHSSSNHRCVHAHFLTLGDQNGSGRATCGAVLVAILIGSIRNRHFHTENSAVTNDSRDRIRTAHSPMPIF